MKMKRKRENKQNVRLNLYLITIAILVLFSMVVVSCSGINRIIVRIPINRPHTIDYEKYDKIIYSDLILESLPEGYTPEEELRVFFLEDLPKIISKDIEHFAEEEKTGKERIERIKEHYKKSPDSLLITGKLIFDIKTRSTIQEVKNKAGKKEKSFKKVQHWTLTLKIELIGLSSGEEVFKKSYWEKMSDADVSNPNYNFEKLFFKINNRLTREITTKKKMQRRYLLTK